MLRSGGNQTPLFQLPHSAARLAVAAILLVVLIFPATRRKREEALQE